MELERHEKAVEPETDLDQNIQLKHDNHGFPLRPQPTDDALGE